MTVQTAKIPLPAKAGIAVFTDWIEMQKRDFIQQAMIEFMPGLGWDIDKSLAYAERAWQRLSERGYGDTQKQGPREIPKAYDQLQKLPMMKAQFDLFWAAFDYKQGRDRAAARWLQMGELSKSEYDQIIKSAKQAAEQRKKLPEGQIPKMAEGWLTERRWSDSQETQVDQAQKQQNEKQLQIRQINQDLAHAKKMAEQTGEDYWQAESEKLTEKLKQLRNQHDQQP
jgi:hypothetical protein